jgi:hypothetical protein
MFRAQQQPRYIPAGQPDAAGIRTARRIARHHLPAH